MIEFVIEAMVDAVVVIDAEGRITTANGGAAQLSGYTRDELRGMAIAKFLDDDHSGLRTMVRRRIEDGAVLRREESWLITAAGERIPVSVTGSAVLDEQDELKGIVLVARDIRELRQLLAEKEAEISRRRDAEQELLAAKLSMEEQLHQTRTQLLLAERRATLGTLAGGVGHELRNIAQIQVAAVDELAASLRANEDVTSLARQILPDLERVGDHITEHGNRLMQLAHPGADHSDMLDLNAVVRDVAAMLKLAGKLGRVDLVLRLVAAPVIVTVNRTRIEQILVNLIINAVDAIGVREDGTVTVSVRQDDNRVICTVADTGPGIPAELREKIFEPFFTTKGAKGTGLGLPVVKEIVTSYGGTIEYVSGPTGTTFTFDLPS
ncbi:MAG TPA: ATP-binding protein [Kofleriaceae bacterium]|nr:ATP-binding protein [Kofleriaceae bacterium]